MGHVVYCMIFRQLLESFRFCGESSVLVIAD